MKTSVNILVNTSFKYGKKMFAVRMAESQTVHPPSPPATLQMGKAMGKRQAPSLAAL